MPIPSYQIRNILSSYVNLLAREASDAGNKTAETPDLTEKIVIKAEGKRRSVIDKVIDDIIGRITCIDPVESSFASSPDFLPIKREKKKEPFPERFEFAYFKIENDGEKRKAYLSLENGEKRNKTTEAS